MIDKNCLSYWYPVLQEMNIPAPRTEIVRTDLNLHGGLLPVGFCQFLRDLEQAALRIDKVGPWFLRTGQGSGKHSWNKTCYVEDLGVLAKHVFALVEWSEMVDMIGLKSNVWVVREFLTSDYIATMPAYGNMLLVPEWRFFIRDGKVECQHPYWPFRAIEKGMRIGDSHYADHCHRRYCLALLDQKMFEDSFSLAKQVASGFNGYWSVDVIKTHKGLFVTDMAEGERSWHWLDCKYNKQPEPQNGNRHIAQVSRLLDSEKDSKDESQTQKNETNSPELQNP